MFVGYPYSREVETISADELGVGWEVAFDKHVTGIVSAVTHPSAGLVSVTFTDTISDQSQTVQKRFYTQVGVISTPGVG
jgi:hypothetical protein